MSDFFSVTHILLEKFKLPKSSILNSKSNKYDNFGVGVTINVLSHFNVDFHR